MTFTYPLALLLLLPAAGVYAWVMWGDGATTLRLPGHWHRVIEQTMRPLMATRVVSEQTLPMAFWLMLWSLLVFGIAGPIWDAGSPSGFGNLAGRVIAIDLGTTGDIERQRRLAYRLIDASPKTPTALVIATAEAFDVVPLTTDRDQLARYLEVMDLDVMPLAGRAPGIALTHSEGVLERAGTVVGQVVLISGGAVPRALPGAGTRWLRSIVVRPDDRGAWATYASAIDAQLHHDRELDDVVDALDDEIARALRDSDRTGDLNLTPWLLAGAAFLWLLYFRRIRAQ
ncbi:MAG: hypothetical protein AAF493_13130 [Pseudomonadota bacterium]